MDRANDPAAERLTLVIGDRNLSSWSLRPWLAARQAGIPFAEIAVRLGQPDSAESIRRHSPSGKVPCLLVGEGTARWPIWDSLAICEYLAEQNPDLWPTDRAQRAEARSVSAEMHSGFSALRQHLSMNINASRPLPSLPPDVAADVGDELVEVGLLAGQIARIRRLEHLLFEGREPLAALLLRSRLFGLDGLGRTGFGILHAFAHRLELALHDLLVLAH